MENEKLVVWLVEGYQNTKFFQNYAWNINKHQHILDNEKGGWYNIYEIEEIMELKISYFQTYRKNLLLQTFNKWSKWHFPPSFME